MHPPRRRPHPGHRALIAAAALSALAIGACGSSSSSGSTSPAHAAVSLSGKAIFSSAGCAGCHTLSAAGAVGNVGPNLDNLKPSYATVVRQVTDGGGQMPSFRGQLSTAQIRAVAHFVASATH